MGYIGNLELALALALGLYWSEYRSGAAIWVVLELAMMVVMVVPVL